MCIRDRESQPTEVAGSVTTHSQLLPEGGHSSVGGHGSMGSVSSSSMGVTLGYPSGHPDPHSSMIASAVESQCTASSAAIGTPTTTTGIDDAMIIVRQPPIGIETAAATNPTLDAQVVENPTYDRRRSSSVTLSPPTLSPAFGFEQSQSVLPVSYTHLTLPTIYSV